MPAGSASRAGTGADQRRAGTRRAVPIAAGLRFAAPRPVDRRAAVDPGAGAGGVHRAGAAQRGSLAATGRHRRQVSPLVGRMPGDPGRAWLSAAAGRDLRPGGADCRNTPRRDLGGLAGAARPLPGGSRPPGPGGPDRRLPAAAAADPHRAGAGDGSAVPRRFDGQGRGHLPAQHAVGLLQRSAGRAGDPPGPQPGRGASGAAGADTRNRRRHRGLHGTAAGRAGTARRADRRILLYRSLPGVSAARRTLLRCRPPLLHDPDSRYRPTCRRHESGRRRLRHRHRDQCAARHRQHAPDARPRQGDAARRRPAGAERTDAQDRRGHRDLWPARRLVAV